MSLSPRPRSLATACARAPEVEPSSSRPLVPPLDLSVVYCPSSLDHVDALYEGTATGPIYAREGHPNADQLARKIAELEGAQKALVCSSGMAAITAALCSLLNQGDHLLMAAEVYGKTSVLVDRELSRYGVARDLFDAARPDDLAAMVRPSTRLILVETLSNPLLRVTDLPAVARVAADSGVTLVVDNTFAPCICRPLELGAHLVVHSATKMIGGHSDLTLGVLAGSTPLITRAHAVAAAMGLTGNPFESWLALRGMATLPLRMERACTTATALARRFERAPQIRRVWHPALDSHPDAALARALLEQGGSMLAVDLGDRPRASAFMAGLPGIPFAPSLGDVQTTLSHPCTTSHRGQDQARLERFGITPGVVRISVGLEDERDLWAEFAQSLQALTALESTAGG